MAKSVIGALEVLLTTDITELKSGLKKASDAIKGSRKSINESAVDFAKWGTAGATAAAGIGAALFKIQSENIRELKNLAFAANDTVESFQRGAYAAQQFGIEQDKFGTIMQDVTDRVGDFVTTGGGPMVDFFEQVAPKVGITADAFRGLSGEQALGLFVKSMQDANLSQEEMTFHMEAMASDSTRLIPLFQDNAKALKAFKEEAKGLGIGLDQIEVAKVENAHKALDRVAGVMDSTLKAVVTEMAPFVEALANQFIELSKEAGGTSNLIAEGFDTVIDGVGFVMDAIEGVDRTFQVLGKGAALVALGISESMLDVADAIVNKPVEAINDLVDAYNAIPFLDDVEYVGLTSLGEGIREQRDLISGAMTEAVQDISDILNEPMPSTELEKTVERVRIAAHEAARITAETKQTLTKEDEKGGTGGKLAEIDSETAAIIERLKARGADERQVAAENYMLEQEQLLAHREAGHVGQHEHDLLMESLRQEHIDRLAAMDEAARSAQMMQIATNFDKLATVSKLGGKKTEKITRALSITSAVIKGHESAVSAYAAGMATGGPAAPATAALYAAASIAQTAMMIQKLKSGSKSNSRPSGGVPKNANGSAGGGSGSGNGQQQVARRIDINLGGSGLLSTEQVRELIGQINQQVGEGVELSASNVGA